MFGLTQKFISKKPISWQFVPHFKNIQSNYGEAANFKQINALLLKLFLTTSRVVTAFSLQLSKKKKKKVSILQQNKLLFTSKQTVKMLNLQLGAWRQFMKWFSFCKDLIKQGLKLQHKTRLFKTPNQSFMLFIKKKKKKRISDKRNYWTLYIRNLKIREFLVAGS